MLTVNEIVDQQKNELRVLNRSSLQTASRVSCSLPCTFKNNIRRDEQPNPPNITACPMQRNKKLDIQFVCEPVTITSPGAVEHPMSVEVQRRLGTQVPPNYS